MYIRINLHICVYVRISIYTTMHVYICVYIYIFPGDPPWPPGRCLTAAGRRIVFGAVQNWCSGEVSIKRFSGWSEAQGGWQHRRAPVVMG